MNRKRLPGIVVALVILGMAALANLPLGVGAQDASPAAAPEGPPPGLTFETLAFIPVDELPATPAFSIVDRVTIEPGAVLPSEPDSPNLTFFLVEQGTLTIQTDAPIGITRGQAVAAALEAGGELPATEQTAAGADVTMETGDAAAWPGLVGGELRNDGAEPVVLLAVNIVPADALQ
jgi:hypothetical protein